MLVVLTKLSKVQKNFGKTPAELEDYVESFEFFIPQEISGLQIVDAMVKYAQTHADMPVPAQVMNIISYGYPEPKDGRFVPPTQKPVVDA